MFSGSIPALVTPFRDGAFDEQAFRRLVEWQIENGSSRAGALRHHRGSLDPEQCRAPPGDRSLHRTGGRAGAGDRRLRQQRYDERAAAHEFLQEMRRCGGAVRCALLQPAEPGRIDRAFQLSCRAQRSADRALQCSGPHRDRSSSPRPCANWSNKYPQRILGIKDASGDLSRVTDHRMGIKGELHASCAAMTNCGSRTMQRAGWGAFR